MTNLPNPFDSTGSLSLHPADEAVASAHTTPVRGAAADQSSMATGGHQEAPAAACWEPVAAELFDHEDFGAIHLYELMKRGFDVEEFLADIEPLPLFLQAPLDVLHVLAAY